MRSRPASTRRNARPAHRRRSLTFVALATVLTGLAVTGCSRTVIVEPAKDAANPKCADILLTLPDEISGEKARTTSSQGTKAWEIPTSRCCAAESLPGPTTDQCVSVSGVD